MFLACSVAAGILYAERHYSLPIRDESALKTTITAAKAQPLIGHFIDLCPADGQG